MAKVERFGTLNVSGVGELKAKPDIAIVRLAVVTEAETAAEAVENNAMRVNSVVSQVNTVATVSRDDIRTTGLTVFPVTRYDKETREIEIVGYRAVNAIAVTVPVEMAGKVFDAGIASGADQSSGITFALRDEKPYRMAAIDAAVASAQAEAERVARAVYVRLLGPKSIDVEQGGGPLLRPVEMARADAGDTPVFPGQLTIAARVQITYYFDRRCR